MIVIVWVIGFICAANDHTGWAYLILSFCVLEGLARLEARVTRSNRYRPGEPYRDGPRVTTMSADAWLEESLEQMREREQWKREL